MRVGASEGDDDDGRNGEHEGKYDSGGETVAALSTLVRRSIRDPESSSVEGRSEESSACDPEMGKYGSSLSRSLALALGLLKAELLIFMPE